MTTNHFTFKIMVNCLLVVVMAPSAGFSSVWEVYQQITGVGEISQTYPGPSVPNRLNLHYSGGASAAETASFEIDVSGAEDWDRCDDNIQNAGLCSLCTHWECNPLHGTVDDGAYTTDFTPSSGVYSGIWIKATVKEGHEYSWVYGNYDDPVTKQWGNTLKTFKVGVQMQPGDNKFWEDDAGSEKQQWLHSQLTGLTCEVSSTTLGKPKQVTATGDLAGKNLTWEVLAQTDSGTVEIMGSIGFTGKIQCNGEVRIIGSRTGVSFGSLGTLASTIVGQANPYIGAVVSCIVDKCGSRTHWKIQLLGSSVIENASAKTIGSASNYVSDYLLSSYDYNLNSLNVSRAFSGDSGDSFEGSLDLESVVEIYDNSISSAASASVVILTQGSNYMVSTKPIYSP